VAKNKYWDGSAWQEVGVSASKATLIDNGNLIVATDVEGALQEIVSASVASKAETTAYMGDITRRKIHVSTLEPTASDGADGDMWVQLKSPYTFVNDTIGDIPVGWAYQFGNGFTVQEVGGSKVIKSTRASLLRSALRCDDEGIISNFDIKTDIYVSTKDSVPSLIGRLSGTTTAENGYTARVQASAGSEIFDIFKYVAGTGTQLASAAFIPTINTWYTIRFKVEGINLYAKFWLRSATEPGTWNITTTDSSLKSGYVGIFEAFATGVSSFDNWQLL
jgi:hypothetical protein